MFSFKNLVPLYYEYFHFLLVILVNPKQALLFSRSLTAFISVLTLIRKKKKLIIIVQDEHNVLKYGQNQAIAMIVTSNSRKLINITKVVDYNDLHFPNNELGKSIILYYITKKYLFIRMSEISPLILQIKQSLNSKLQVIFNIISRQKENAYSWQISFEFRYFSFFTMVPAM